MQYVQEELLGDVSYINLSLNLFTAVEFNKPDTYGYSIPYYRTGMYFG